MSRVYATRAETFAETKVLEVVLDQSTLYISCDRLSVSIIDDTIPTILINS